MDKPQLEEIIHWKGHGVVVREYSEPTDLPWNGDEPVPSNAEGWDLTVEVELTWHGQTFKAHDSVCGNWIIPDAEGRAYIKSQLAELRDEALFSLEMEIRKVAAGEQVMKAVQRQNVAFTIFTENVVEEILPIPDHPSFDFLYNQVLKLFPKATVEPDLEGQLVVYTNFVDTKKGIRAAKDSDFEPKKSKKRSK